MWTPALGRFWRKKMKSFRDYFNEMAKQITFMDSEFYPDYLETAKATYIHFFEVFTTMCNEQSSSEALLLEITKITDSSRIQLLRLFRLFFSPDTSVEMLKRKGKIPEIISEFGSRFRDINEVKKNLSKRGLNDETLFAILYEYKDRGQNGYELTEHFFTWFKRKYGEKYSIEGPIRAGSDVILNKRLKNYKYDTPADFLITDKTGKELIIGFARYDSDRGGSQEDDRTSGNQDKVTHIREWCIENNCLVKIVFLNDGPGLLLGSMWEDYSKIEESWPGQVTVLTLRMLEDRFPL